MPTHKAIHICNYSQLVKLFFGVRECKHFTRANARPKIAKEYVFAKATENKVRPHNKVYKPLVNK